MKEIVYRIGGLRLKLIQIVVSIFLAPIKTKNIESISLVMFGKKSTIILFTIITKFEGRNSKNTLRNKGRLNFSYF